MFQYTGIFCGILAMSDHCPVVSGSPSTGACLFCQLEDRAVEMSPCSSTWNLVPSAVSE